jgi:hypothetical protein
MVAGVCGLMCLSLWLGIFFGLNYPEIRINTQYKLSQCTVLSSSLTAAYCCYVNVSIVSFLAYYCCQYSCSYCSECGYFGSSASCSSVVSKNALLDPFKCDNGSISQCADVSSCCNGYHCCSTCCSTCTSCSTSCSTSSSGSKSCSQSCHTYSCNCYCCSSVANQRCDMICPRCYTVTVVVGYDLSKGDAGSGGNSSAYNSSVVIPAQSNFDEHAVVTKTFKSDLDGAKAFQNSFQTNTTHQCWYDPTDYNSVVFQRGYSWWKWFLFSFPSMFLLLFLCAGTYAMIESCLLRDLDSDRWKINAVQIALWMGCLFPFLFFLPLEQLAPISSPGRIALVVLITTFVTCGCFPLFFVYHLGPICSREIAVFSYYFFFGVLPIGILLPIALVGPVSAQAGKALLGISVALPAAALVISFCLYRVSDKSSEDYQPVPVNVNYREPEYAPVNSRPAETYEPVRYGDQPPEYPPKPAETYGSSSAYVPPPPVPSGPSAYEASAPEDDD